MEIEFLYMDDTVKVDFLDSSSVDIFKPKSSGSAMDFNAFKNAYENSNASSCLESDNLLIVVNDAHRSTPTAQILQWYKKLFPKQFSSASFLVACGTHLKPSKSEYELIFGDLYDEIQTSLYYHDCHNKDELQAVGVDTFGEELFVNKKVFAFDKIWFINSVEPHYFAGFTGGRKSLVPGLADFKTIERNHNLANSLDCAPTKLIGNPVAEHLDSLVKLIDQQNFYSLQIVTDIDKNICDLSFGTLQQAFQNAVKSATEIFVPDCKTKYDLLLLEILPPLDRSIYQAQKALENCQAAVKDSGSIIIFTGCKDGIGSEHFYQLAENWDKVTNQPKDGKVSFGSHKLKRVNDISKRINVFVKSTLPDDVVRKLFYKPINDVTEYIANLSKDKDDYKIGVVYDAAHVVLK